MKINLIILFFKIIYKLYNTILFLYKNFDRMKVNQDIEFCASL